jgi:hypothetical protein
MNAIAHAVMDRSRSSRPWGWSAPAALAQLAWLANPATRRAVALAACWGSITAIGVVINTSLDFPALRAHVALACAALSSAIVLVERWGVDPDRLGAGGVLATLAGATSAWATLI